jgi:hypothetical protein
MLRSRCFRNGLALVHMEDELRVVKGQDNCAVPSKPLTQMDAKLCRPGMLNSLAGFVATITNIYTARNKFWSRTAIITAAITGACASILMILFSINNFWNLRHVKEEHARLFQAENGAKNKRG